MTIARNLCMAALCLTSACDGTPSGAPVGRALRETDTSHVPAKAIAGGTADAETMRTRRVAGTWRSVQGGDRTEATFGNDGTLSVQIERGGGIVDAATGRWALEDGRLTGTMDGGRAGLSRYASWNGAFANDTTMNVSGPGGSILTLRR